MKHVLTLLLLLPCMALCAQSHPITSITISLPANPDPSTANWRNGASMLAISATARMVGGRVDPRLEQCRILVWIKKQGSKVCGSYVPSAAPTASFSSLSKTWSGVNAVGLLGQDCELAPGEYELCVQFYGPGPAGMIAFSDEKCRSFTIRPTTAVVYQPPQPVTPLNGTVVNEDDSKKPMTFRWTPVIPRPGEGVQYRLKVWQMVKGQSATQAIQAGQPIVSRDFQNVTQALISNTIPRECANSSCEFVWNVQALNREGKPLGTDNGTGEAFIFKTVPLENAKKKAVTLLMPPNGSSFEESMVPRFSWSPGVGGGSEGTGGYKIKITEIPLDQSPEAALRGNKPFFEKDSGNWMNMNYPRGAPALVPGRYAWAVEWNGIQSQVWSFVVKPRLNQCKDLGLRLTPEAKQTDKTSCCYNISLTNKNGKSAPYSIRIFAIDMAISSVDDAPKGWKREPKKISGDAASVTWTNERDAKPVEGIGLGTICFSKFSKAAGWIIYEWMDKKKNVICRDSIQVASCNETPCRAELIRNGEMIKGNQAGLMPGAGAVQHWVALYGSPKVNNDPNDGFAEPGYIELNGNRSKGQAIAQQLDPANKIVQGKRYKLSVAVRFKKAGQILDRVRIRAIAFNSGINFSNAGHPGPSGDVAIIGRSGSIRDCGDWSIVEFPSWKANKDFSNIAINAFTNGDTAATVLIDAISICEANSSNCEEVQTNEKGEPITPAGYGNLPAGADCESPPETDEYLNGSLVDLYPGYDGTSSLYSSVAASDNCFTIGGTVPEDAEQYSCDDSLKAAGIDMTCEEFSKELQKEFIPTDTSSVVLPPIPPLLNTLCDLPVPGNMAIMPFNGRDIIYIHGLQMEHLVARAKGQPGATGTWPANQNEYFNGYYRNVANTNMLPHIDHFIRSRGHKNRFLVVAYDCSQNIETAIHAALTQIREAMQNGTNVQADPSDPRGTNCFGRDFVFISHSTGAIVADVLLSIANKTKQPGALQNSYGNVGLISDRCKGRVSIQGAFSGSNLAKLACIAGPYLKIAVEALADNGYNSQTLAALPPIISQSVLVDLTPSVTRQRWASYINDVPVPVFSLAGGHPSAILLNLKYIILPGFDDGVLTSDCVNGNNNPLMAGPSAISASGGKIFDMGIPLIRAKKYYRDRKISNGVFATASTAWLSPTGMVEPVNSVILDPQNHFNNHFSFIQSTKEHWFKATQPDPNGNLPCDYGRTVPGGYVNNEESLVVTDASLYNPALIHPSIITQVQETVAEQVVYYPWVKLVIRHGMPKLTIYWKKFYVWKRTYHKLADDCMYDVDYAYKYLFTQ